MCTLAHHSTIHQFSSSKIEYQAAINIAKVQVSALGYVIHVRVNLRNHLWDGNPLTSLKNLTLRVLYMTET